MKRPTTDQKKRALGNLRPGTSRDLPSLARGRPKMPLSLTGAARKVWRRTVDRMVRAGTVAEIHTDALVLYAEVWSQFEADPKAAKPSMVAQIRMLQDSLGLSPASHARVPVLEPPEEQFAPPKGDKVVTIASIRRDVRARLDRERAKNGEGSEGTNE